MAGAPTGIAAANIEEPYTDIGAVTLHNMLELDQNCKTKLDLSNMEHIKVAALHNMDVLMIDEASKQKRRQHSIHTSHKFAKACIVYICLSRFVCERFFAGLHD